MASKQPKKWRDTIDPFLLKFHKLKILKVLGYPHAANDVFYMKAYYQGKKTFCFLKYARHIEANFKNEIQVLEELSLKYIPEVLEYASDYAFIVTREIEGERLSTIVGDNLNQESLAYMEEYGRTLAFLHQQQGAFPSAPRRKFHDIPEQEQFDRIGFPHVYHWLISHQPKKINYCFVHGDFHYANILWKDHHIHGILDFELAGIGNKEFDIAWAIILRPSQRFLHTRKEMQEFIRGYQSQNSCDVQLIKYYMALIYARFYELGDTKYKLFIKNWYRHNI